MMNRINVSGAMSSRSDGTIANEQGMPVSFDLKQLSGSLDQSFLRRFIKYRSKGSVFVFGENSFKELEGTLLMKEILLREPSYFILSSKKGVGIYQIGKKVMIHHSTVARDLESYPKATKNFNPLDDTLESLRKWTLIQAARDDSDVVVLGGKSVYKAFVKDYTEFHHTLIRSGQGSTMTLTDNLRSRLNREVWYEDDQMIYRVYYRGDNNERNAATHR